MPLEVRFKHNPEDKNVFIGTALGSSLFHLWKPSEDSVEMKHRLAVSVPSKNVENWALPSMPGLITDIIISMDDNFIFFSNWLHGDIRMYDIRDPFDVKLVGQVFVGGSIHKETSVKVTEDSELKVRDKMLIILLKNTFRSNPMQPISKEKKLMEAHRCCN